MAKIIPNAFTLRIVLLIALGSSSCSYGLAVISSTIGQISFYRSLGLAAQGEPGYDVTARWIGAFNGVICAGVVIGALVCSWAADRFSRKHSVQAGAIVLIVGGALSGGAISVAMFMVGRVVAGLGIGLLVTAIPMYQSEISTAESRGFVVSMHGVMFAVGYLLSSWMGFGVYFISASGSDSSFPWRFPVVFQGAPALLLLLGSPWMPYSPRWLVAQNRCEEARAVLGRFYATEAQPDEETAEVEFLQIQHQVEVDNELRATVSPLEIFKTAPNRRRAVIAVLLMVGNQFTGTWIMSNYAVIIYTNLGMADFMPLLLAAVMMTITLPCNLICAFFVERVGRRKFMLIGIAGMVFALVCEVILQAAGGRNLNAQKAAVLFIFLFMIFWATFMDATQFLYLTEIFPTRIRSQGNALGTIAWQLGNIVVLVSGPVAFDKIGWKFFLVFISVSTVHFLNVYFLFPETKGRTLEEINAQFGDEVAIGRGEVEEKIAG